MSDHLIPEPIFPEAGPLQPDPVMTIDLVAEAIARLKEDAGAVFEPEVLELLRNARDASPAQWARHRQAIKATGAVSMADLDRLTRPNIDNATCKNELFASVTIHPDPVDGAALLSEIAATIRRHVIADPPTIHAATLWVAFTWFIDVVDVAPIANITAPDKRCGKSVMLGVLARLSCRPLAVSNIAPAALFRALELWTPTLLIDEVDSFLSEHEEARGILNAGFTRDSAFVVRCVGDDHTPTRFNVWGAKALCGIGKIADTLADRSIPLCLRRKLPGERTIKMRHADAEQFAALVGKLARFAVDNRDAVHLARPTEIEGLNDRANDAWEPLLAIAAAAGGDWPRLARLAAITLHGLEGEPPSIGAELLADVKAVFDDKLASKIFSADLLKALVADEESPWASWNRGKPISPRQLSARLADFGIKSKDIRIGSINKKGYDRADFSDAFERYLSTDTPSPSATTRHAYSHAASSDFQSATPPPSVADKKTLQPSNDVGCRVVTDITPMPGGKDVNGRLFRGEI
ncbi:DUF3631 domain-containing protein [Pseudomonas aeruginosa]|uniref:DUF3631 domain-containing protein n=1 Tax=Pseudomonas aeruginosa TaxID=287 RepID=UPI00397E7745